MSLKHGMAALNLEMSDRVPRTEYSFERHWELVKHETGIEVTDASSPEERLTASTAMFKAWDIDLIWNVWHIHDREFTKLTKMGHASFEANGSDYDNKVVCPFKDYNEALAFNAYEEFGPRKKEDIIAGFNKSYAYKCGLVPDTVNMTGLYVSLVSGLIEIFGWDMLLMAMGMDPEKFGKEVTGNYARWIMQYFEGLAECDSPVVMVHDDIVWTSGPFTNPAWYRQYVFPRYKELPKPLRDSGKKILYTSDANYTEFFDDVVACGFHSLVFEPTTDMALFAEKYGKTHAFIGNADTRILLNGTKDDIRKEVQRCMDIGKHCPGFFMAVGNHIPANTPLDNALYYNDCVRELGKR